MTSVCVGFGVAAFVIAALQALASGCDEQCRIAWLAGRNAHVTDCAACTDALRSGNEPDARGCCGPGVRTASGDAVAG